MKTINLKRSNISLYPDCKRVLLRPFHFMSGQRASEICAHIMALSEDEVDSLLGQLWAEFGSATRISVSISGVDSKRCAPIC